MRKSGGGAQVVRNHSATGAGAPRSPSPGGKPGEAKPRWSGSLAELAARKRQCRKVVQPSDDTPAAPTPKSEGRPALPGERVPASALSTLLAFRRHWNGERRREVPCWLASLLLHMLAVVSLGSLTIPVSGQKTVMTMLLSFGEIDAPTDESHVDLLPMVPLKTVDEATTSPRTDSPVGNRPVDHVVNLEKVEPTPEQVAKASDQSLDAQDEKSLHKPMGTQASDELPGTSDTAADQKETQRVGEKERLHDIVVDKFIEFDVGRLTGAEGAKARHDFDRLGPTALRSLVRGLNKSASIHASCPVMVIAAKIETVLRENPDSALLRYALENIGRDVPEDAPHIGRLQGLLSSLKQLHPSRSQIRAKLLARLKLQDRRAALTGLEKLATDAETFADFEKRELAWEAIRLLNHNSPELRRAAHDALVALADGADCGPANDRPASRAAAVRDWSLHFDPDRYQDTAAAVLKIAKHLVEVDKRDAAHKQFQRIVRDYSGTAAAEEAAEYLNGGKKFALK